MNASSTGPRQRWGLACFLALGFLVADANAVLISSTPLENLTPSVRGYWDASAPAAAGGLADLSGNGWTLAFGAQAPAAGSNATTGRDYLAFESGVTTALSTVDQGASSFFDTAAIEDPYAMILAVSVRDPNRTQDRGSLMGTFDDRRRLIAADATNSRYDFAARGSTSGVTQTNVLNIPAEASDVFLLVHQSDGSTRRLEAFTNANSWGSGLLGRSTPFRESFGLAESGPLDGGLVLNQSQAGVDFYGAIYLDNPTASEVDTATGWAAAQWLLGERDKVLMYQGDSTTEVGSEFADRTPGWNRLLHEEHLPASTLGQNFANGGKRAIANGQFGLADEPQASVEQAYAELWNLTGADVFHPLMIGTNDIGADLADPADVVAAIETWASEVASHGGSPLWLGCCPSHQRGPLGENRTELSQTVYDRFLSGENAFADAITALRDSENWGWDVDTRSVAPELMADMNHPNSAGNEELARLLADDILRAIEAADTDIPEPASLSVLLTALLSIGVARRRHT